MFRTRHGLLAGWIAVAAWAAISNVVARSEERRPPQQTKAIQWQFDRQGDFLGWKPNAQVAEAVVRGGAICGRAVGNDPILVGPVFALAATPLQSVEIRMKSTAVAHAELFWTETLQGEFGGFSASKHRLFSTIGDGQYHVYRIWPFWQAAKKIVRLRVDPPDAGRFEIQWIRIAETAAAVTSPAKSWSAAALRQSWSSCGDVASQAGSPILLSPLLSLPPQESGFACVRMAADCAGSGRLFCVSRGHFGWESTPFPLRADGKPHAYNIDLGPLRSAGDEIILLGLQLPGAGQVRVESLEVARDPCGPADLELSYFGPVEGVNRTGRPCGVSCTLRNLGAAPAANVTATLRAPPGVRLCVDPRQKIDRVTLDLPQTVTWKVQSEMPGTPALAVTVERAGAAPLESTTAIDLTRPPDVPKADYVPEPKPVRSKYDIGVYYFPGWSTSSRWQPIRDYPGRKPILGWYDEANPECADWQIKWAVEHGVTFFMVDWYWCQGHRHLEHWVHDAYSKARYRKYLKWAVMWANHNPPHTHSREDWRAVTQFWIDHYFAMPEYYRIDQRPVVFLWSPQNVRRDLGGSAEAARLYALSQEMARAAGYPGVYFIAMSSHDTPERCREVKREGFEGLTDYHGFQPAWQRAGSDYFPYAGILDTSREFWQRADQAAPGLLHIPIVDTGWDPRPWHGNKTMVAEGRTPELFGRLCRMARQYADQTGKRIIAVGPWNEWGEGSYIEPYAQYAFQDLDQLRAAFCEPGDWPPNLVPADVGRGPYDLPPWVPKTAWEFNTDGDLEGWSPNADIAGLAVKDGLLVGRSTGHDPVLVMAGVQVEADRLHHVRFRLRTDTAAQVQIYWATTLTKMSNRTSVNVDVTGDGQFHEYDADLARSPEWRGLITTFRFDPTTKSGAKFAVDYIRLH